MSSLLVWNKETGEIMACLPRPRGNAPEPTANAMFASRPDLLPILASAWIPENLTTLEVADHYEIKDGKPIRR